MSGIVQTCVAGAEGAVNVGINIVGSVVATAVGITGGAIGGGIDLLVHQATKAVLEKYSIPEPVMDLASSALTMASIAYLPSTPFYIGAKVAIAATGLIRASVPNYFKTRTHEITPSGLGSSLILGTTVAGCTRAAWGAVPGIAAGMLVADLVGRICSAPTATAHAEWETASQTFISLTAKAATPASHKK